MRAPRPATALVAGAAVAVLAWHQLGDRRTPAATAASDVAVAPPACDGFDLPVGPPDGAGYYDAQRFGDNTHLGDDYNGVGGGDSDLGDPVYAIAAGVVTEASDRGGGWGNVARIAHACGDAPGQQVESLYAHLETMVVAPGQVVHRGDPIGTIGTAGGRYPAHLHLELRAQPGLPLGGGYGTETTGYLDPARFIARHRPASPPR